MPVRVLTRRCEGNSAAESSEEKECPDPGDKRKFRLRSVSGDGKRAAMVHLWVLREIAGARMNREYSYLYLSIPIRVAAPRRHLWSLSCFVNTHMAVCANKVIKKQELKVRRCVPQYVSTVAFKGQIILKDKIISVSQTEQHFGEHRTYCQKLNYEPFAQLSHSNSGSLFSKTVSQLKS